VSVLGQIFETQFDLDQTTSFAIRLHLCMTGRCAPYRWGR
jgi:hypothetical protein